MISNTLVMALILLSILPSNLFANDDEKIFIEAGGILADPNATIETKALFVNLQKLAKTRLLIGHQNSTFRGVGWINEDNRSDVKSVTGSFPAVYGWDLNIMENPLLPKLIRDAHARGGINTISWHMRNPVTGGGYDDATVAVKHILPGGYKHIEFTHTLDGFVDFLDKLKDKNGRPIPLIFRPWHENTGYWFWWGTKSCTSQEFVKLWQFTVHYLRDNKNIRNLLYAYSPHKMGITDKNSYLTNRFPGEEYIDVLGIDHYYNEKPEDLVIKLRFIVELAEEKNKIPALTETGPEEGLSKIERADWFTGFFLEPIKKDQVARKIAYALFWQNIDQNHFWVPYPGHKSASGFKKLYNDPVTVFEDDLPDVYSFPMKQK
jgi:mannan endo-1,4-beta-mannosidase